jgi:hypothetical protein
MNEADVIELVAYKCRLCGAIWEDRTDASNCADTCAKMGGDQE